MSPAVRMGYRPEIDGLRGVAVLAVIINHFNDTILPGGYLGVDVFFVISGFVITASLAARNSSSFAELFLGFYARRVRRLLPALILFVLIAGVLVCFLMPDPGGVLGIGRRALFGISNIQLYRESIQYFSESAKLNPYTHTWSLGVEEQFYLLFPFLVAWSGFSRSSEQGPRRLAISLAVLSALSLALFIYLYPRNQSAAYFLMPSRFWEMGAGCLLFLFWMKAPQNTLSRIPRPVSAVTVVVLLTTFLLPLQWAVVATILAVLATTVMILSIRQGCVAYRVLAHPLLVKVGLISYSLYLWHWGVLAFSRLSIGISWWTIPFQVLLMAALAIASYRTVESPLRKLRWSPRDGWTIAIGISALIVAAALLLGFRLFSDRMYLGKFKGKDFEYVQARMSCELMNIKLDRSQWRSCLDRSGVGPHLFVLGDSHASNLVPSLQAVAPGLGFVDLRYLTNAMPHPFHTADTRSAANFWGQSKEYRQWIEGLNSQDVVVFTRGFSPDPQAQRSLRQQLTLLAAEVPARGATLVLVDDIPRTCDEEDFRRGFLLTGGKGCRISKQEALAHRAPYTQLLQQVSQGKKGIVVLDPLPELCEGNACYPTLRGKILYVDTSPHFSLSNPAPLAPFFRSQFSQRGLGRPSGEELP
ncbi:MAG: acyltransferase family protein [Cyanobacteriota bacterium]|nr:acyltransferase family protein [Cyanobacteriota bacterium]